MNDKIHLAILDDHPAVIEGYLARLRESENIVVVGTALRGELMEQILADTQADVLIFDLGVPVSYSNPNPYPILLAIPRLIEMYPDLKILVISMYSHVTLIQAVIEAGARGYIVKDDLSFMRDFPSIIENLAHGGSYFSSQAYEVLFRPNNNAPLLSSRQKKALALCAAYPHESTAELAERLEVASSTMRNLLSSAYIVLQVHSRVAAVARAQQLGFIQPVVNHLDLRDLGGEDSGE